MPRRKDSDDEYDIDDALEEVFYYEPVWDGKKRRKMERVALPKNLPSTSTFQSLPRPSSFIGDPSAFADNSLFAGYDDHTSRKVEVLPVKGKVRSAQLHIVRHVED